MTSTNSAAGNLLDSAKRTVCQERSEIHGDTESSFRVIAEFWMTYLSATNKKEVVVLPEDVTQMMSLLKKVRHIFGNKMNEENFVDDIGYVSIAGMFAGVKPIQARAEPEQVRQERAPTMLNKVDMLAVERAARGRDAAE